MDAVDDGGFLDITQILNAINELLVLQNVSHTCKAAV